MRSTKYAFSPAITLWIVFFSELNDLILSCPEDSFGVHVCSKRTCLEGREGRGLLVDLRLLGGVAGLG